LLNRLNTWADVIEYLREQRGIMDDAELLAREIMPLLEGHPQRSLQAKRLLERIKKHKDVAR